MRNLAIFVTAAFLTLSQAGDALACKCAPPPPVATALEESTAVFAGKVTSVSRQEDPTAAVVVKIKVSQAWKGASGDTIEVRTRSSSAACGIGFEEGAEWLVYASTNEGALSAISCSRTKPLGEAAEDLAALGKGNTPAGGGTTTGEPATSGPPPVPPKSGGCACELATPGGAPWGLFAALGAAVAVVTRRRGRGASERRP
jgi:MYXO-CTERM domain-containing protein